MDLERLGLRKGVNTASVIRFWTMFLWLKLNNTELGQYQNELQLSNSQQITG